MIAELVCELVPASARHLHGYGLDSVLAADDASEIIHRDGMLVNRADVERAR